MQSLSRIEQAIIDHRLPSDFNITVSNYYSPLASKLNHNITQLAKSLKTVRPQFIGIQGSQGSGKSTCADFLKIILESEYNLRVLTMSIDDFYLTSSERQQLAKTVHPLFITRGVPGTHDVDMIQTVFDNAEQQQNFTVPYFNKALDDRADEAEWQNINSSLDVVILEGWCVGISAQDPSLLDQPCNELERDEDDSGLWRQTVNAKLTKEYQQLFSRLNHLVTLQVPSFNCVYEWRLLQEQKMINRLTEQNQDTSKVQTPEQLKHFIAHYQRLTEHALEVMPKLADYVLKIDEHHHIIQLIDNN